VADMMIITIPSYLYDWQSHKMTGGGYTIILYWIMSTIQLH